MKDPFDILRADLVSAAERAALPAPRKRWGWLRRPSRPMAVLLAGLVIAGAGGAAVVSLTPSASPRLAGGLHLHDRGDPQSARRGGGMGVAYHLHQDGRQHPTPPERGDACPTLPERRDAWVSNGHVPRLRRRHRPR